MSLLDFWTSLLQSSFCWKLHLLDSLLFIWSTVYSEKIFASWKLFRWSKSRILESLHPSFTLTGGNATAKDSGILFISMWWWVKLKESLNFNILSNSQPRWLSVTRGVGIHLWGASPIYFLESKYFTLLFFYPIWHSPIFIFLCNYHS